MCGEWSYFTCVCCKIFWNEVITEMVVFTCNHCGDSLQKPKVEKHYSGSCRNAKFLTCVDCLKDFRNEEYVDHTKCFTEEQRYSAKGSVSTDLKKGELKQESWIEMIASIVKETNLKVSLRNLLNTISSYSNVPRKKAKFINFLKNSLGGRVNLDDVEAVWDIIEKYKKEQAEANKTNGKDGKNEENSKRKLENGEENGAPPKKKKRVTEVTEGETEEPFQKKNKENEVQQDGNTENEEINKKISKKKMNNKNKTANDVSGEKETENGDAKGNSKENGKSSKKRKSGEMEKLDKDEASKKLKNGESENLEMFSFKNTILDVLNSKSSVSLTKLQKKVMNAYTKHTGNEVTEKTVKKYNKKLRKLPNVKVDNETVSLVT